MNNRKKGSFERHHSTPTRTEEQPTTTTVLLQPCPHPLRRPQRPLLHPIRGNPNPFHGSPCREREVTSQLCPSTPSLAPPPLTPTVSLRTRISILLRFAPDRPSLSLPWTRICQSRSASFALDLRLRVALMCPCTMHPQSYHPAHRQALRRIREHAPNLRPPKSRRLGGMPWEALVWLVGVSVRRGSCRLLNR